MTNLAFADVTSETPDLAALTARTVELQGALRAATSVDPALAVLGEWDALRRGFDTWASLADLRFRQDTTDASRKAERERKDELEPKWTELEVRMKRALLDHPLRGEIERRIGSQAFRLWEVDVLAFDPRIEPALVAESGLTAEYVELLAGAELPFRGETHTLSTIGRYRQHAEREVRHGAERVVWDWFAAHGETLDRIYDELVGLRARMARDLGCEDFIELGYRRMMRLDYDRADVERFRAAVREHVVPLCAELRAEQARRLGVDRVRAWDEAVQDPLGNPAPGGNGPWLVGRAREMFDRLGHGLGEFFRHMDGGGFLDLESRDGKAGGGFCTAFPAYGAPFVFANFNGTKRDVEVLTHEIGHAFQNWSSRDQPLIDYQWPTLESCEVHSMSLEFLTWPHMELFFGREAERFRRVHLIESLLFLPYGAAVDHFQHEVFARPDASPAERHGMWREMEAIYLPWRDWGDLAYPAAGGRWQAQGHVFRKPFYYIDYVLAQTCALQFLARSRHDAAGALEAYVALCRRGGAAPFQELIRSAGLVSPFEPGCLEEVVREARAALGG